MQANADEKITRVLANDEPTYIPFFQRSYVWDEDLWERFLRDMEQISETNSPHFFGSLITKETDTGEITLVDGQQRSITFFLFLKAACLKLNDTYFNHWAYLDDDTPLLKVGRADKIAFETVISRTQPEPIKSFGYSSKIIECFNYFITNINPQRLSITSIVKQIKIIHISLDPTDDEQEIFDTLNSLGMPLITSELLKNYFFTSQNESAYDNLWVPAFEKDRKTIEYWDTTVNSGRLNRTLSDVFLMSYLHNAIAFNGTVSANDKRTYSSMETLFKSYKDFIKRYCTNKNDFLEQLIRYAHCFKTIFHVPDDDAYLPREFGIERLNFVIFTCQNTILIPYVLFIEMNNPDTEDKKRIYGLLESYILRRTVTHSHDKDLNRVFSQLVYSKICTADQLCDYLHSLDGTAFVPDDETVHEHLLHDTITNTTAKEILYLIESKIRPDDMATALLPFKKYSLEHLMPQKWHDHWGKQLTEEEEKQRNTLIGTFGNLAIIPQKLNAQISNHSWDIKKTGKDKKAGLITCAQGLITFTNVLNKEQWDESCIKDRSCWIADCICRHWVI